MTDLPIPVLPDDPVDEAAEASPPRRRARSVAALAGVVVLTAVATFLAVGANGRRSAAGPAPLDLSTVSENIAGHYHYAAAHTAAYHEIPCWCGCEQFLSHRDLADCFVRPDGRGWEAHAAGCGVCNGEAAIAERMLDAGQTPEDVAATVAEEFGTTAITVPRS